MFMIPHQLLGQNSLKVCQFCLAIPLSPATSVLKKSFHTVKYKLFSFVYHLSELVRTPIMYTCISLYVLYNTFHLVKTAIYCMLVLPNIIIARPELSSQFCPKKGKTVLPKFCPSLIQGHNVHNLPCELECRCLLLY